MNKQSLRTKGWILEALLHLIKNESYEKISITEITRKAGVARQTFYKNYKKKDDILLDYLSSIFHNALRDLKRALIEKQDANMIHSLIFYHLAEHQKNLKLILYQNLYHFFYMVFEEAEDLLIEKNSVSMTAEKALDYRYNIKFQVGGSMRICFDWIKADMPLSPEEMGKFLSQKMAPNATYSFWIEMTNEM